MPKRVTMSDVARDASVSLLTTYPEPTAIICYNNLVAVGALHACVDLDRSVPGDLAVVGFDDILLSALVTPPLTTCRVPRHELGGQATRLLLNRIVGCPDESNQVILQPEIIVRASAPYFARASMNGFLKG